MRNNNTQRTIIVSCLVSSTIPSRGKLAKKGEMIMLIKDIKKKRALVYCRVSSEDQGKGTSLDEQETLCIDFAKKYKLEIEKIYKEKGSAMKPEKRKMFNEMVEKLRNGVADVVIFAFVDRMSRNPVDGYKIIQQVEEEGLTAIFVQERLYLQAPIESSEMLMLDTVLGVSNYRVRLDKEKCKAGIKARALEGFRPNRSPYGYKNDKRLKTAVTMKKRADFVKKAFELYATGKYTVVEVAEKLYELGFRYEFQPSKMIPKQSLISMLKNPFYTGKYYVKQADEYVNGNHKAIVSEDVYDKVQKLLNLAPKSPRKHDLLYSLLLKCENCGGFMVGDVKEKPNGKRYVYYRCTNPKCNEHLSIPEIVIDKDVESYLKEIRLGLIPKEIIEEVIKDELYPLTQKLSGYRRDVSRKYDRERRLYKRIVEDEIVDEEYIKGAKALIQEEYGDLDSKIYYTQKQIETIKNNVTENLQKRLYDVYSVFDSKTKRKVLELLANSFKCTEKGLKMTFKSAFRKIRKR